MHIKIIFATLLLLISNISLYAANKPKSIFNRASIYYTNTYDKIQHIYSNYIITSINNDHKNRLIFYHQDKRGKTTKVINGISYKLSPANSFFPDEKVFIEFHPLQNNNKLNISHVSVASTKDQEYSSFTKLDNDKNAYLAIIQFSSHPKDSILNNGKLFVSNDEVLTLNVSNFKRSRTTLTKTINIKNKKENKRSISTNKVWLIQNQKSFEINTGEVKKAQVTIENRSNKKLDNITLKLHLPKELQLISYPPTQNKDERFHKANQKGYYYIKIKSLAKGEIKKIPYYFSSNISFRNKAKGMLTLFNNKKNISNPIPLNFTFKKDTSINTQKATIIGHIEGIHIPEKHSISIYLSNGQVSRTDENGRFHFSNVPIGTQVVQIDEDSIPKTYSLTSCQQNVSNINENNSIFVILKPQMSKQIKFCLKYKKNTIKNHSVKSKQKQMPTKNGMPNYSISNLSNYKNKTYRWLWPQKDGFVPAISSIKIALLSPKEQTVKLFLNNKKVDLLNFDGTISSPKYTNKITKYIGVDILKGDNYLQAKFYNKQGILQHILNRKVHFSSDPYTVKFLPKKSYLIADGQNKPKITLQLFDQYGYYVRKSMQGKFKIDTPYQVFHEKKSHYIKERDENYIVEDNGIVHIYLEPTTLANDVKLHMQLQKDEQIITVPLHAKMRKWLLVGFTEGTIAYHRIKEKLKTDQSNNKIITKGQIAFFAKGTISGNTLLTIAYDTGKQKDIELFEKIKPDQQYTIYQDNSTQNNETPSSKKLYIKLENSTYKAIFGDINTGLDTVELSHYDRKINGFKAIYQHKNIKATLFISDNATKSIKDEIRADGTNGVFNLTHKNIVENSEKIYIVTRQRYHKQKVIRRTQLRPLLDYSLDYNQGQIYLKNPVFSTSENENPNYIEINYEINSEKKDTLLVGGRVSLESFDKKYGGGITSIKEADSSLNGIDIHTNITKDLTISGEIAHTKKHNTNEANAYMFEAEYHHKTLTFRSYFHRNDASFGLDGQQSKFPTNTQRFGLESKYKYAQNYTIEINSYIQQLLSHSNNKRILFEIKNHYRNNIMQNYFGYRYILEEYGATNMILTGITKSFLSNKLRLNLSHEQVLGDTKSSKYHTKTILDTTYSISSFTDLFFRTEVSSYTKSNYLFQSGLTHKPWKEADIKLSLKSSQQENLASLYGNYLFSQGYRINDNLYINGSIEKNSKFSGNDDLQEDYTTYNGSLNYHKNNWDISTKFSYKDSNQSRLNTDFGIYKENPQKNLGLLFGISSQEVFSSIKNKKLSCNFSLAYRKKKLTLLNKSEYLIRKNSAQNIKQLSNNTLFLYNSSQKSDFTFHYAIQFTRNNLQDYIYDTCINTFGTDINYKLTNKSDIGINTALQYYLDRHTHNYLTGIYMGYNLFKNYWLSIGYNFQGYSDNDALPDTLPGVYLKMRYKFDQNSLHEIIKSKF